MTKSLVTLLSIFYISSIFAQSPEQGIAIYKESVNIHLSLSKEQAAMKAFIPEFQYAEYIVQFKGKMSKLEKNNKENSRASMLGTETIVVNQNDSTITQYGKIAGVNYKMIEKLKKPSSYLLIDEDKVINGFKCKKAIDKTNDITIWYQPDPKRIAPRKEFSIIPGIVVKVKGKQREYELVSISEETTADSLFTIPKTYKQITQEQHRDLREEAVEELQQSMGAGSRIIQTRDN